MSDLIIGNIIGITATAIHIVSYQFKNKKVMLLMQCLCSLLYSLSFIFLGGGIGAIMNVIIIVRNLVYGLWKKDTKTFRIISCATFCSLIVGSYFGFNLFTHADTANWLWNILPTVGTICGTVGYTQRSILQTRIGRVADLSCWLGYNIHYLAIGGILGDTISIISIIVSIIRFRKDKQFSHNKKNSYNNQNEDNLMKNEKLNEGGVTKIEGGFVKPLRTMLQIKCNKCGHIYVTEDKNSCCPKCQSKDLEILECKSASEVFSK